MQSSLVRLSGMSDLDFHRKIKIDTRRSRCAFPRECLLNFMGFQGHLTRFSSLRERLDWRWTPFEWNSTSMFSKGIPLVNELWLCTCISSDLQIWAFDWISHRTSTAKAKILTLNRFNLLLVEKTLIMIDVKFRCGFKKQAFRNYRQGYSQQKLENRLVSNFVFRRKSRSDMPDNLPRELCIH